MVTDPATKKCKYCEEENSRAKLFKDQRAEVRSDGEKRDESNIPTAENASEAYTRVILVSMRRGNGQKRVLVPPHRETEQPKGRPLHGSSSPPIFVSCCNLRLRVNQDLHHLSAPTSVSLLFAEKCQM